MTSQGSFICLTASQCTVVKRYNLIRCIFSVLILQRFGVHCYISNHLIEVYEITNCHQDSILGLLSYLNIRLQPYAQTPISVKHLGLAWFWVLTCGWPMAMLMHDAGGPHFPSEGTTASTTFNTNAIAFGTVGVLHPLHAL